MNVQLAARESSPVSLGDWVLTLIILCIPLVNLVMLFVWGFSAGTHPSKQNFCRAYLILLAIVFVLAILFGIMGGFAAMHAARSLGGATL
ncbi:MAG TPA: hypothetical protein VFY97_08830 [Rhodanobacteraceae bacterium]|nr:hypothetical protein [Rhodanobacteraceae bacterium]